MRFDIITIFPEFFTGPLDYGIVRRAREARLIETHVHDLRDFTHDRHRTVDDRPFGGGEGMVMKPEPLFDAVESLLGGGGHRAHRAPRSCCFPPRESFSGRRAARRFAKLDRIVLLCGRYEGVDERVAEHLATDEISIGDFVLSGGELPAAMIRRRRDAADSRRARQRRFRRQRIVQRSRLATAADLRLTSNTRRILTGTASVTPAAAFSITRTTRGRSRFAAGMCRKFCLAETTKRFAAGAARKRSKRPSAIARTCCNVADAPIATRCKCRAYSYRRSQFHLGRPARFRYNLRFVRCCVLAPPERVCLE